MKPAMTLTSRLRRACGLAVMGFTLGFAGCVSVFLVPPVLPLQETTLSGTGKEKVLLIDVSGVIAHKADDRGGIFPGPPDIVARVKEELELAAQDEHVKAVVLRINSPGGTVTASDQLYHEMKQFKATHHIPIVAVLMDVGASGAYYVAMAADSVIAHPTSIVGSIGVVMLRINVEGLLEKLGLETAAIKSGTMKDMGSPFRTMTDDEYQVFLGVIMEFYNRFVEVVGEGRPKLKDDRIRELADGRIYTAGQALNAGLVDELGYLDTALDRAKQAAGLTEARVVTYHRPGTYTNNIYSGMHDSAILRRIADWSQLPVGTPQFLYLWGPA
ncbi:MAG TPA: signal peptide peptidase SppA [Nitrospirales bacterium]|nr:signal peptide peptidase SppA [Nitrospirales bacterium]